ncbi:MAG: DUF1573 domain-containing protein [Bacteroides sp.]|nr:DUF1573 domain-containing protein [Bacteroides sp.]
MKRMMCYLVMALMGCGIAGAQGKMEADIKFDKTTHNFGEFPADSAVVSHTFTFTNVGNGPLVIHQAYASCGCTVPEYTQEPVLPGKTGTLKVTYDGSNRRPGSFMKSVTLRTNGKTDMIRIFIEGEMVAAKSADNEKKDKNPHQKKE